MHIHTIPAPHREANTVWDELNDLYVTAVGMLQKARDVSVVIRGKINKKEFDFDVKKTTEAAVKLFESITAESKKLEAIHDEHKDYTGGTDDINVHVCAITLGEKYRSWLIDFQSDVMPRCARVLTLLSTKTNF